LKNAEEIRRWGDEGRIPMLQDKAIDENAEMPAE
jgi:hypothetical protein